ncbi:Calponin (CH) domain containing protein [Balamuthia mandrillaris]
MEDEKANLNPKELERRLKEKKWQQVQIKGLTSWVNSYLTKAQVEPIKDVPADITDGVKVLQFLELVTDKPGTVPPYKKAPRSRIEKIENCSKAVDYIKTNLDIKLVGIGAEDLADGDLKLILGLLWSTFRKLNLGSLSAGGEGKGKPEDDLLQWIGQMTEGYPRVKIDSFKRSFNDGLAWAALIDRFDPEFIDFDALLKMNATDVLNKVFDVAEEKLGIPKLFEASDLTSGDPDERSVVLYSSLFYHAWTSNADRIKLANEKRGLGSRMDEVKSKLQKEEEEIAVALSERDSLLDEKEKREKNLGDEERRLKQLEDELRKLEEERDRLNKKLDEMMDSRNRRIKEEMEQLERLEEELKKKLNDEREKRHNLGRQNIDLLSDTWQQAQKLKRALGLRDDEELTDLTPATVAARMESLCSLLREHVNVLHAQFKEMQEEQDDEKDKAELLEVRRGVVDKVQQYVKDTVLKDSEEEKRAYLQQRLQSRGKTFVQILKVKDAVNELREVVDKKGFLMAQVEGKRWKKRWFVLRGCYLSYYNKKEDQDDISASEGELSLENAQVSAKNDEDGKPKWTITFEIHDGGAREELIVGTKTKEERDDWLFLAKGKVLYLKYLALCETNKERPDTRILSLFPRRNIGTLSLEGLKLTVPVLQILTSLLVDHTETERLSFTNTEMGDKEVELVAEMLRDMPNLLALDLSYNNITSAGAKALAESLMEHTLLQEINLSHNQLDDAAIEYLTPVFDRNTDLDIVDLSFNKLQGDGDSAANLITSLSSLKLLSSVQLNDNQLSDSATLEVAKLATQHPSVIAVHLQNNNIGDEGAIALFHALKDNKCVKVVDLSQNKVGTAGLVALRELWQANSSIETVHLSGNRNIIGGKELAAFKDLENLSIPAFSLLRN